MKLFIWQGEGVLQDYTSGQIVVLAPDLEQALQEIESHGSFIMDNFPRYTPSQIVDLGECTENVQNEAWITWGGG